MDYQQHRMANIIDRAQFYEHIQDKIKEQDLDTPTTRLRSPGRILLDDYLIPKHMSTEVLATLAAIEPWQLQAIIAGRRDIDEHTSCKLARVLGTEPYFWSAAQVEYNATLQAMDWPTLRREVLAVLRECTRDDEAYTELDMPILACITRFVADMDELIAARDHRDNDAYFRFGYNNKHTIG